MCSTCATSALPGHRTWGSSALCCGSAPPWCSGASSEIRFKLKALLSFSVSYFETRCFQARVKLAPPYLGRIRVEVLQRIHQPSVHRARHGVGDVQFETSGLKGLYFQAVETRALSTRGVELLCLTCASALPRAWSRRSASPSGNLYPIYTCMRCKWGAAQKPGSS